MKQTSNAITTAGFKGTILGTPPYMAPEQIRGDPLMGVVSDVWAFGIMLFEALTGRHPIDGSYSTDHREIMSRILNDEFPSPKDIIKDVPSELNDLCKHMLVKDCRQRMEDLDPFISEITNYLKSRGGTISNFGTFYDVSRGVGTPITNNSEKFSELQKSIQPRFTNYFTDVDELQHQNQILQLQCQAYKKKNGILADLAQLGILSGKRKRELWAELAKL